MDIRSRLFAPLGMAGAPGSRQTIDVASLILRLLLFEHYIIDSSSFEEIPALVRTFGPDASLALCSSGALTIHHDTIKLCQVDVQRMHITPASAGRVRVGPFDHGLVRAANPDERLGAALHTLDELSGLTHRQAIKLKGAFAAQVRSFPPSFGDAVLAQFRAGLTAAIPPIHAAVAAALREFTTDDVDAGGLELRLQRNTNDTFEIETNLGRLLPLGDDQLRAVLSRGLFGIGGLDFRLHAMQHYIALTGMRPGELSVLDEKLAFLLAQHDPQAPEKRLRRVLTVADLPAPDQGRDVDLQRVLELRQTPECQALRGWLWTIDDITDEELRDQVASFRVKARQFGLSGTGKTLRWLATTGIGVVNPVGAITLSLLDTFLLDKVLRSPGPVTFLNAQYPTIFRGHDLATTRDGN